MGEEHNYDFFIGEMKLDIPNYTIETTLSGEDNMPHSVWMSPQVVEVTGNIVANTQIEDISDLRNMLISTTENIWETEQCIVTALTKKKNKNKPYFFKNGKPCYNHRRREGIYQYNWTMRAEK